MQRLFSMFPKGPPGAGLLLLRIGMGWLLLHQPWAMPEAQRPAWTPWLIGAVASALCVGLVTPLACLAAVALVLVDWGFGGAAHGPWPICLSTHGVALALLGPGAFSLDALVFGRRRILYPPE